MWRVPTSFTGDEKASRICPFFSIGLGELRYGKKQELATALSELTQESEHTTGRMLQMLHSTSDDPDDGPDTERITLWFDPIPKSSTYALVSFWIDDKSRRYP